MLIFLYLIPITPLIIQMQRTFYETHIRADSSNFTNIICFQARRALVAFIHKYRDGLYIASLYK